MANNLQQQVDAYETAGLGTLQKMQQQNPKLLVGIALENLQNDMQADQRAKQMGGANVGPSVIDKKLAGLSGLGLGQQEALSTARPGLQQQGQQMQAMQLAKAMQQAQKRPAGGIASMPMMRNQMRRMAEGGDVEAEGTGFMAALRRADEGLKADEAARQAERMARGRRVSDYIPVPSYYLPAKNLIYDIGQGASGLANLLKRRPAEEAAPKPFDVEGRVIELLKARETADEEAKARIDQELSTFDSDTKVAARRRMSGMQAGGAVKKFQPGGSVTGGINPQTGLPYTQEEFDALMATLDAARDTSIKVGDDTMVDASRLRDPNRLTPAQESERDLAIIERRRADLERPNEDPSILQSIAAGLPALREEISGFMEGARRAPAAMQRTFADTPMGQDMLRQQEERVVNRQNAREREQLDNMYATQNTLARSQLTDEQRLKDILQKGKLVAPSTMTEEEAEKSRAGLQPEKTPMSDKIFSLLQTLGDFSGAPKGYEGATFLARRRARDEAAADRQARADLLEREVEGRFDLMQEQERLRSQEAREIALADYAGDLTDLDIQNDAEFMRKAQELREMYEPGFFGLGGDEAKLQAELVNLYNETRARKIREMSGYLGLDKTAQTEPVQEYANYNPNVGQ